MSLVASAPSHWAVTELGSVVEILDRQRVPVNARDRAKRQGEVPYYGATGQVGWIDDSLFDEELVLLGEDGAPFLDPGKPVAYIIRGKSWVNNHAHVLRMLGMCPNAFLMYQLNQVNYRPFVSGTTRLKLSQRPMRTIPLLIPPLAEQHRIVEAIESYFTRLDSVERTLGVTLAKVAQLRRSILMHAFAGKLVEQDPNDEPASILLEEIKAEQESMQPHKRRRTIRKKNESLKHDEQLDLLGGSAK